MLSNTAYMREDERSWTLYSRDQEVCTYLKSSQGIILKDGVEFSRITLRDLSLFLRAVGDGYIGDFLKKEMWETLEPEVELTSKDLFGAIFGVKLV